MEIVFHRRLNSQFWFRVVCGQQNKDCGFSLLIEDLSQQVMETFLVVIIIVIIIVIVTITIIIIVIVIVILIIIGIIIVIHCYCYTLLVFV